MKKVHNKMKFLSFVKTKPLPGASHDFIRTEQQVTPEHRRLIGFVVIQLLEQDGMHEVVKHDCAHGEYHVHRKYEGPYSKVIPSTEPISNELFLSAKRDVLDNWKTYRDRFIRKYFSKPQ